MRQLAGYVLVSLPFIVATAWSISLLGWREAVLGLLLTALLISCIFGGFALLS